MFVFIFLIQNMLLWKARLLDLGQKHISFKWVRFPNCPHSPALPVLLQSRVKLVWKPLYEQSASFNSFFFFPPFFLFKDENLKE